MDLDEPSVSGLLTVFNQHASVTSVSGEPLLIWSRWKDLFSSIHPRVYGQLKNRGVREAVTAQGFLERISKRYSCAGGAILLLKGTPVSKQSGSGRRALSAASFSDAHTLIYEALLVEPIDKYLRDLTSQRDPNKNAHAFSSDSYEAVAPYFAAPIECSLEPLSIEGLVEYIAECVARVAGVAVDETLLKAHVAPICQLAEPSIFLARTLCRCSLMVEIIGMALSAKLRAFILSSDFKLELPDDHASTCQTLLQELVETRQALTKLRLQVAAGVQNHIDHDVDDCGVNTLVLRTTDLRASGVKHVAANHKTLTLAWSLNANLAFKNAPATLTEASKLAALMTYGVENATCPFLSKICGKQAIARHCLALDAALDLLYKDKLEKVSWD